MILVSKVLPYQVCLILCLANSVLTYLCASPHREVMLPPGSASYVLFAVISLSTIPSHKIIHQ